MTEQPDVIVVGGGLAGLAAAAHVADAGRSVAVYEARGRLGGRATTDERSGFLFNQGPHALYRGGVGMEVLNELGIQPKGGTPAARGHAVLGGRRYELPADALTLFRTGLLRLADKLELAKVQTRIPKLDPRQHASITVAEWLHCVTDRPGVRALLQAFVRLATYTNAPGVLSADAAISQLQLAMAASVMYLDGGWQQLVDRLRAHPGVELNVGQPVQSLPDASAVIVAAGGPEAASALVGHRFRVGPSADASVLDLGLAEPPPTNFALGIDQPLYLSNHSAAADVAPKGRAHVAVARYLETDDYPSREDLLAFAEFCGVKRARVLEQRWLRRMTVVNAIPKASTGGMAGRPGVEVPDRPWVFVAGDWVGADGYLADAALASGREAARLAVKA